MLDISNSDPFTACTTFAVQWLSHLAANQLDQAVSMIDIDLSETPLVKPVDGPEGFHYARPDQAANWSIHFLAIDDLGFAFEFEVPFIEKHYRPMLGCFQAHRDGNLLQITFEYLKPT